MAFHSSPVIPRYITDLVSHTLSDKLQWEISTAVNAVLQKPAQIAPAQNNDFSSLICDEAGRPREDIEEITR